MPSTVRSIFEVADIEITGKARWGETVRSRSTGVYVVSMSADPAQNLGVRAQAPISVAALRQWLAKVPAMQLDGYPNPQPAALAIRLADFWLADESILYIGMTTARLGGRIRQYYTTPLGARKPHAGGHWLKTLALLDELYVYYGECSEPDLGEQSLLARFITSVSPQTRAGLRDPERPFPFANLEFPKGNRKDHGISKSKA